MVENVEKWGLGDIHMVGNNVYLGDTALRVSRVWMVKEAMLITSPVIIIGARDLTNFGHKQSVRLGLTLAGAQEVEQVVGVASLFTKEKALTARGLDGDFCLEDMGGSQLPKFMGQFTLS